MPFVKTRWFNSLVLKVMLAFIAGVIVSIGLLVLSGLIMQDRLPGMDLSDRARNLADKLHFNGQGEPGGFSGAGNFWIYTSLQQETAYRVLDEKGQVVLMSPGAQNWPPLPQIINPQQGGFEFTMNNVLYEGTTEPFYKEGKRWFIQLSASSRIIGFLDQEFADPFIRLGIVVFSLVMLLVFGLCVWVMMKYSLMPLRRVSAAAASISPRSLDARLQRQGVPEEILPLIDSFNQALDRLEKGYLSQQDFLATAAHELKTPLTLIRAEVELMENNSEVRESLLMQVGHLARQVQQLLLLAEASELRGYQFSDVNVHDVVGDCVQFLQRLADDAQVSLVICVTDKQVIWQADRGAFFTLLKNLIENAIQHAPSGSEVRTSITRHFVSVRDFGPGVEEEVLPLLFTRFWRGEERRDSGAGLGLSVCQEVAVAHGFTLTARNARPGLIFVLGRVVEPGLPQIQQAR